MLPELKRYFDALPQGTEKLYPRGYYPFSDGIRVEFTLHSDGTITGVDYGEKTDNGKGLARPFNGRTSGKNARLLVDELQYLDQHSDPIKHKNYLQQLHNALELKVLGDLQPIIERWTRAIEQGEVQREIDCLNSESKQSLPDKAWFSIKAEVAGQDIHLFETQQVQQAWLALQEQETNIQFAGEVYQAHCSCCGTRKPIVRTAPVGVRITKAPIPLTSQNESAFLSHWEDTKTVPIGMCLDCANSISSALNHLLSHPSHHQQLTRGDNDSQNQVLIWWVQGQETLPEVERNFDWMDDIFTGKQTITTMAPSFNTTSEDIKQLTQQPHQPTPQRTLTTQHFHAAILSPTKGRIIVRTHLQLPLPQVQKHVESYLKNCKASHFARHYESAPSLSQILSIHTTSQRDNKSGLKTTPSVLRKTTSDCIKAIFFGRTKPRQLLLQAIQSFKLSLIKHNLRTAGEAEHHHLHTLACILNWYRRPMNTTDNPSTLAGRLLAVLELAQQKAHKKKYGRYLDRTLTQKMITSVTQNPRTQLTRLLQTAEKAYFRDAHHMKNRATELMHDIHQQGGLPGVQLNDQQADFLLGYYTEMYEQTPKPQTERNANHD